MSYQRLFVMKLLANLKDKIISYENSQCLTCGHKTLGVWWLVELPFSHQGSLYLVREVAPKPPTFHTANRWHPFNQKNNH